LAITSNNEINEKLRYLQNALGITPSPFDCFMLLRGLKTLHIRMERHEKNAMVIAEYLEKHEKVEKVTYPGLKR
jgi:cystathionine beta-lyase/cystathionine gamma-synthase